MGNGDKKIEKPFQSFNKQEKCRKKYSTKEDFSIEFAEAKCEQLPN